jgi:maltose alpha-D-glucosyltransferase/alpha-amylase
MVFPGVEDETWTYDTTAAAWYGHRLYRFEPDLNTDHPAVREEIRKITLFWLRLGVAGCRVDAAPFLIEPKTRAEQRAAYEFLGELREWLSWHRGDAVMLAEANVSDDELIEYFGHSDGSATRVLMIFAFRLNQAIALGLARQDARPIAATLHELPRLPRHGQWATFLRQTTPEFSSSAIARNPAPGTSSIPKRRRIQPTYCSLSTATTRAAPRRSARKA